MHSICGRRSPCDAHGTSMGSSLSGLSEPVAAREERAGLVLASPRERHAVLGALRVCSPGD